MNPDDYRVRIGSQDPISFGPGTLGFALEGERLWLGHVRFVGGRPKWHAGPVRFPAPEAA